jgi:hypothetical protein
MSTDLLDARRAIVYEKQWYTSELAFDTRTRTAYRKTNGNVQYFGPPSAEIDENWEVMMRHEFPVLYADEAPDGLEESNRLADNQYHFEPDMFHNLHCLNKIRYEVSKSIYPGVPLGPVYESEANMTLEAFGPDWPRHHMEHCMDRIRQALICHGDLTPSITRRWNGVKIPVFETRERLCRKWEPIRQWMDERHERDGSFELIG